jgi:hypothetical protein
VEAALLAARHSAYLARGALPVSSVDPAVDFMAFGVGPGVGDGPAYPIGLDVTDSTLSLAPAQNFGSLRWMGQKVLWFVHPRYRGPS